eukprot:TRINITY_DN8351_c0_g1_i2.p1 TRINITY_DN8351_c0_g1~~TRINITY_DN8351_c0_g1_i2.p1  ORF type:complete len:222 (-),score=17.85 TRINITY_DN8351_c0_g1_i2:35-700(-)
MNRLNSIRHYLLVSLLLIATIGAQSPQSETIDEATILISGDLSNPAIKDILSAAEGIVDQGETGNSYLLVPENATVIIFTAEEIAESQGLETMQQEQVEEPKEVDDSSCDDTPPDWDYTCQEQKRYGKCDADFMLVRNYCAKTCGRCEKKTQKVENNAESSTGQCMPLPDLLRTRDDTQSFIDAVNTVGLMDAIAEPTFKATVFVPNDNNDWKNRTETWFI